MPNKYLRTKWNSGLCLSPLLGDVQFLDVRHILGVQPGGRRGAVVESHSGCPGGSPRCGAARWFYMQTWNFQCRPWSTV